MKFRDFLKEAKEVKEGIELAGDIIADGGDGFNIAKGIKFKLVPDYSKSGKLTVLTLYPADSKYHSLIRGRSLTVEIPAKEIANFAKRGTKLVLTIPNNDFATKLGFYGDIRFILDKDEVQKFVDSLAVK